MSDIYESTVAQMRAVRGGEVEERDYFPMRKQLPYRLAQLNVGATMEEVPNLVRLLLSFAKPAEAHITIWTHYGPGCQIHVSLSRPLTDEEIGDDPPCASRPVSGGGGAA